MLAVHLPGPDGKHSNFNQDIYGSEIKIEFKGSNNRVYTLNLGHLTDINEEVVKAAREGTTLPAGTFLGKVRYKLGVSDGPHLHITNQEDIEKNKRSKNLAKGPGQREEWVQALREPSSQNVPPQGPLPPQGPAPFERDTLPRRSHSRFDRWPR